MPRGKGKGKGGNTPQYNRPVPKFLQQYAHLLGAERPDPSTNDQFGFQSTAVEEGYNSDGDQVVDNFLKSREKDLRKKKAEEEEDEPTIVDLKNEQIDMASDSKKILFQKRPVETHDSDSKEQSTKEAPKKNKRVKKALNNKK